MDHLIGTHTYEFTLRDIFGDDEIYGFDLDEPITRRTTELDALITAGVPINKVYSHYTTALIQELDQVSPIIVDSSIGDDNSIYFLPTLLKYGATIPEDQLGDHKWTVILLKMIYSGMTDTVDLLLKQGISPEQVTRAGILQPLFQYISQYKHVLRQEKNLMLYSPVSPIQIVFMLQNDHLFSIILPYLSTDCIIGLYKEMVCVMGDSPKNIKMLRTAISTRPLSLDEYQKISPDCPLSHQSTAMRTSKVFGIWKKEVHRYIWELLPGSLNLPNELISYLFLHFVY